ncbi:hypothetical protein Pelo_3432 [Pelomyxa schiedti]|nr:hypothetical protein Pelo_3432 [Pelomyxa schiedti]
MSELRYLGHLISSNGDQPKFKQFKIYSRLKIRKVLCQDIYSIRRIKEKDIEWHWEEAEQKRWDKPFTIETDASITALSDEGQIHPIAFASHNESKMRRRGRETQADDRSALPKRSTRPPMVGFIRVTLIEAPLQEFV